MKNDHFFHNATKHRRMNYPTLSSETSRKERTMEVLRITKTALAAAQPVDLALPHNRAANHLLSIAGTTVIWQDDETFTGTFLAQGGLNELPVRRRRGRPSRCHFNSARLWGQHSDKTHLMTGYGLNNGIW